MKKFLLTFLMTVLTVLCATAQNYAVELKTDKKVIYVDKLGLADNTTLLEILRMIPELVVNDGDEFLRGYTVSLDSKGVAFNKDVLLATMKLYEIEKIEISTSATASQQMNKMAGSIKIVSRPVSEGLSGSATANANTLWSAYPNLNLNYGTDKLELRGNVGLEYYSGSSSNYFEREKPLLSQVGKDTINDRYFQETARLYLKYTPTKRDALKLWVQESFGKRRMETFSGITDIYGLPSMGEGICRIAERTDTANTRSSKFNLGVFAEYSHVFRNEMKFTFQANYVRDANKSGSVTLDGILPEKPQVARSEAKLVLPFISTGTKVLKMNVGGNVDYDMNDVARTESRSFYASPFMELEYDSPEWKLNAGLRYQYFDFVYDRARQGLFSKGSHDFTFNVNTLWQMADHHALRFFVTKNIIRPSFSQIYPYAVWDRIRGAYVIGNENLGPASMYSFELDYITDWNIGDHKFVTDASLGYDRVDGLVNRTLSYDEATGHFIMSYVNSGINNILKGKVNILYSYGIFSVSLAGNWYHNDADNFNVGLSSVFSFRNDWTLSGTFRYNSPWRQGDLLEGDCFYSNLRLSKTFGKWIANVMLSDIFDYVSEKHEYTGGGYSHTLYDQYPRCFEIGVTYRIGR